MPGADLPPGLGLVKVLQPEACNVVGEDAAVLVADPGDRFSAAETALRYISSGHVRDCRRGRHSKSGKIGDAHPLPEKVRLAAHSAPTLITYCS